MKYTIYKYILKVLYPQLISSADESDVLKLRCSKLATAKCKSLDIDGKVVSKILCSFLCWDSARVPDIRRWCVTQTNLL